MEPHYDERARQQTQQNVEDSDHSMTLGSGATNSMIQIKFLFNKHFI